ncbi:MAG: response regulator transcription factor [Chloroflexi bacterium]|nr:response regulator transcription factor [Chloroflexota bacterium]
MIRVLLADDHVMFRQAIARSLADAAEFQIVGQASTAEEALHLVALDPPQVVLMDIGMPSMGGLAATKEICRIHTQVAVLILTAHDRDEYFFQALSAGASGYILKEATFEELTEAIQSVARGTTYVYPSMVPKLVTDHLRRARNEGTEADELDRLSAREQDILRLIAEGLGNNEIAKTLNLSPHTVRHHREHIMDKLDLRSKAHLIRFAISRGLLQEPGS